MDTPIFDGLVAELDQRLASESFWPDWFLEWVWREWAIDCGISVFLAVLGITGVVG